MLGNVVKAIQKMVRLQRDLWICAPCILIVYAPNMNMKREYIIPGGPLAVHGDTDAAAAKMRDVQVKRLVMCATAQNQTMLGIPMENAKTMS